MLNIKDKELRKVLAEAGLIENDKYFKGDLAASHVVRNCDRLFDVMNALTKYLNIVLKASEKQDKYYFVKRKKSKDS